MGKHVSAKELADHLAVDDKTVLKWSRAGTIPRIVWSKRCIRFDLEACEKIIKGRTIGPA
jgi:predicted site-specific integrase-resolvase